MNARHVYSVLVKRISSLKKGDIGLSNVDNTSDNNKPISAATQTALNNKVDKTTTVNGKPLSSNVTITQDDVADGTTNKAFKAADKTKLDSIVIGASGNVSQEVTAHNADQSSHPGMLAEIAKKTTTSLNGTQTNVNFIRNEIVKDGLIGKNLNDYMNPKSVQIIINSNNNYGTLYLVNNTWQDSNYIRVHSTQCIQIGTTITSLKLIQNTMNNLTINMFSGYVDIILNGKCEKVNYNIDITRITYQGEGKFTRLGELCYSHILTIQEIQHNFNVLSNSPSISKINDYVIASDTDHVTDSGSILQSKINRVFYKNMCKEFTSNGEAITVNNGMDGYVLSGKLEGNTVKCFSETNKSKTLTMANKELIIDKTTYLTQGQKYYLYVYARNIVGSAKIQITNEAYGTFLAAPFELKDGLNEIEFTCNIQPDTNPKKFLLSSLSTTDCSVYVEYVFVSDVKGVTSYIPFGLNSTKATISNNGLKYSFYKDSVDKASGTVITLGGVGNSRDVIDIKEDNSSVYNVQTGSIKASSVVWYSAGVSTNGLNTRYSATIPLAKSGACNCTGLFTPINSALTVDGKTYTISLSTYNNNVYIIIPNADISTFNDVNSFMKANDFNILYELATPIVATIDKSLVPAILTQLQNQFVFGEGVAPYSVTIKAPTTDDITKSYAVSLLNAYTQTASTATPIVNLLNTGIVRLQMDLTAPSTGMNATIFTLPLELRPITTQRIPVFVNGVCQLATIDKTTGNVNLPSVPSASANIYIKTDYRRDI